MKLEVIRFNKGKDATNGLLFDITNDKKKIFMLYSKMRAAPKKVWGETCIPEGEYCLGLRTVGGHHSKYSKRFADIHSGMLQVLDVPNFTHILIHCGNTDEDTAGCLLLGDTQENNNIKENGFIGRSTLAYMRVYPSIAKALEDGEDVTITYRDFETSLLLSKAEVTNFFDK